MKGNVSKWHLLKKKVEVIKRIGDTEIKNSECEKLLGIKVDAKLSFNEHLNDIISKASPAKSNALLYIILMSLSKKKKPVNSFLTADLVTAPISVFLT